VSAVEVLLLPGLDGTGELFGPFLRALPQGLRPQVARYSGEDVTYEGILERLQLPAGPFAIVAESFSGPLGVLIAARCSRARALVLAASFVRNPSPLTAAAPLLRWLPQGRVASGLLRRFMLGDDASEAECEALRRAMGPVRPAVVAQRLAAIRGVDVRRQLRALMVPAVLLRPTADRLIPRRAFDEVAAAGARVIDVQGAPHLVLQRAPEACARALSDVLGV
jgi:pimeloyl-ACP methyl ester carboxylesterase